MATNSRTRPEKCFPTSSRTRRRKGVLTNQGCNRLEDSKRRKGFPTSQGCTQLEDSLSERFSSQPQSQPALGLVAEQVSQVAKVATSSKTRYQKGVPTRQGCNQLEDSSSKRFSNQQRLQAARGLVVTKIFQPSTVAIQCNQLEDTSSKRFSNRLTLQQAQELVVENVFKSDKVPTCSRTRHQKAFPTS